MSSNLQKLKEEIEKRCQKSDKVEVIFETDDELVIINRYDEKLFFYDNGKVTSKGNRCRFMIDALEWTIDFMIDTIPSHQPFIYYWNAEEKCGYWRLP